MYENGIMDGTGATRFSPDGAFTKSQLAEALYAIADKPEVTSTKEIADVAEDDDAKNAIIWALDEGILSLDVNGNFHPDEQLTEMRLAITLFHAAIAEDVSFGSIIKAIFFVFEHALPVPTQSVTRGEAAMTLLDYINL